MTVDDRTFLNWLHHHATEHGHIVHVIRYRKLCVALVATVRGPRELSFTGLLTSGRVAVKPT
jgi:hypothetical protein